MNASTLFDESEDGIELGRLVGLEPTDLCLFPAFLPLNAADRLFADLQAGTPWRQEWIRIFGAEHPLPRLTAWHGEPGAAYVYSGLLQQPLPWTPELRALRDRLAERVGQPFDSVLLNLYRDGSDTVAWHADDEPELGPEPVITSVSLGATRRFRVRRRDDHSRGVDIDLEPGSLLLMRGRMQRACEHCVPRTRRPTAPRINLTFRRVVGAQPALRFE